MKLPVGQSAFNHLLNNYKQNSKNKGIEWKLSKEEFQALTLGNCHYCGKEPSKEWKGPAPGKTNGSYRYNGVDRLDSDLDYEPQNTVSCCGTCNLMKNTKSVADFIAACKAIVTHQAVIA